MSIIKKASEALHGISNAIKNLFHTKNITEMNRSQVISELAKMTKRANEAYAVGAISVGSCGDAKVQMTDKFFDLFRVYDRNPHDSAYDRCTVTVDGVEFFCLVDKVTK